MSPELIIFDCDGVLVDSEPIANRMLTTMLNEIGLGLSFEDTVREFMGRSMEACAEIIERRLGHPLPDGFLQRFERRLSDAFRRELRPVPGIAEALEQIPQRTCVASSGSREKMSTTLGLTGLLPRFEGRLFSAADVSRGKPHPDLFLHAAQQMGARPERCVVVEDAVRGVQAGVAAGMSVLGYPGLTPAEELAGAGATVFTEMRRLPAMLRRLARDRGDDGRAWRSR